MVCGGFGGTRCTLAEGVQVGVWIGRRVAAGSESANGVGSTAFITLWLYFPATSRII